MSDNNEPIILEVPQFNNLAEECAFWKDSALKWKEKYEHAKRLYADVLYKSNCRPLKVIAPFRKCPASEAVINPQQQKKPRINNNNDPFDPAVFKMEIQSCIINHLTTADLLKMTEVSRPWKRLIEVNRLLDAVKLRVDFSSPVDVGRELLTSQRRYHSLNLTYGSTERDNCFQTLKKFARSLEEVTVNERHLTSMEEITTQFPKLKSLKFTYCIDDETCNYLTMCCFEELEVLHVRRRGPSEALVILLHEVGSLREVHIAADSQFYRGWFSMTEDDELGDPEMLLEVLHVEIIDFDDIVIICAFLDHVHTITTIIFSGICKFINVTQALTHCHKLKQLTIAFTMKDDLCEEEEDEEELNEEMFSEELEPHDTLEKLTVRDVDVISMEKFKSLLLYTPNLRELIIGSPVTREIMKQVVLTLPKLEVLILGDGITNEAIEYFEQMHTINTDGHYNTNFRLDVE